MLFLFGSDLGFGVSASFYGLLSVAEFASWATGALVGAWPSMVPTGPGRWSRQGLAVGRKNKENLKVILLQYKLAQDLWQTQGGSKVGCSLGCRYNL